MSRALPCMIQIYSPRIHVLSCLILILGELHVLTHTILHRERYQLEVYAMPVSCRGPHEKQSLPSEIMPGTHPSSQLPGLLRPEPRGQEAQPMVRPSPKLGVNPTMTIRPQPRTVHLLTSLRSCRGRVE